ncbi:hypothetical protein AGLY_016950 [Aphis glycines]|uniref:C2H2-type domain-containing protein n=1 Tax=Aphis glycines TaxID=307491 RepID=A0A6G0SX23_APHGL|nr:hypothetical protein AGLY_016950 [Aphis glycines]
MICFICKSKFSSLSTLVVHFKIIHMLKPSNSFKRHIQKHTNNVTKKIKINHKEKEIDDNTVIPENINKDVNLHNSLKESHKTQCENVMPKPNNYENGVDCTNFNIDIAINTIHQSAINFTMSLHNNNNFSRKDVVSLQKEFSQNPLLLSSFHTLISAISTPFKLCSSEYLLNKWLTNNNLFTSVNQFTIHNEINLVSTLGETNYNEQITKGILMPIQFQFKSFFENDNNLNKTLTHYQYLKNNSDDTILTHFIQGALWKEKMSHYHNKIVIPYFLYIDDFEVNNPLSSHSSCHSICAIYYSFPLSDQSKLSNIFVAALLKSIDIKNLGNDQCLKQLINELNKLEIDGKGKKVHFILALLVGDNLGLNSVLEFSKSFFANYFCRFCKENKLVTQKAFEENVLLLRNYENYLEDINTNDFKLTDIYKEPIFNQLNFFHATTNYSIDIMYDIFEGICHYNMCHIIKYYTENVKNFSLHTLNLRKQNFNYGSIEIGNASPLIQSIHIQKFHLKMTAREMMTFVHFFLLMIGYIKPKHHILLHYPSIIKKSGPPKHFWCFRYEAKHKDLKAYARNISSRKNITLSLAKNCQYKYAYNIMNYKKNKNNIELEDKHKITSNLTTFLERIYGFLFDINLCSYSQIDYKGTTYKTGYFLTNLIDEVCLYEILEIVINLNNLNVIIVVNQIEIDCYCPHLKAYKVNKDKNTILKTLRSTSTEEIGAYLKYSRSSQEISSGKLSIEISSPSITFEILYIAAFNQVPQRVMMGEGGNVRQLLEILHEFSRIHDANHGRDFAAFTIYGAASVTNKITSSWLIPFGHKEKRVLSNNLLIVVWLAFSNTSEAFKKFLPGPSVRINVDEDFLIFLMEYLILRMLHINP